MIGLEENDDEGNYKKNQYEQITNRSCKGKYGVINIELLALDIKKTENYYLVSEC